MFEDSSSGRIVSIVSFYMIYTFYLIGNKLRDSFTAHFLITGTILLITISFISEFYFLFGLISISVVAYKVFESLGSYVEQKLNNSIPSLFAVLPKLSIWLVGFIGYLYCLLIFVIKFIRSYPNHSISKLLINAEAHLFTIIGIVILSLIIATFILDFLIKMVRSEEVNLTNQNANRFILYKLFGKISTAIIFSDLTYSLMYVSFSGTESSKLFAQYSTLQNFSFYHWIIYCAQSFYYAFCLHFSIPMPTTDFFNDIDKAVKTLPHLQIIQFFHTCINKIVDLTILAYTAGVVLKTIGFSTNQSKNER